jgi:hypothetical protein
MMRVCVCTHKQQRKVILSNQIDRVAKSVTMRVWDSHERVRTSRCVEKESLRFRSPDYSRGLYLSTRSLG